HADRADERVRVTRPGRRVPAREHSRAAAADRERPGDRRPTETDACRGRHDQRTRDPSTFDVDGTAANHAHRSGLDPTGTDTERLPRRNRQRACVRAGQARARIADSQRPGDERREAVAGAPNVPAAQVIGYLPAGLEGVAVVVHAAAPVTTAGESPSTKPAIV